VEQLHFSHTVERFFAYPEALSYSGFFPRGCQSCKRMNNLTPRRQGAKTCREQISIFFAPFGTLRLGVKCSCLSRDFFTVCLARARRVKGDDGPTFYCPSADGLANGKGKAESR
jgi:hypothetical protein